MAKFFMVKKETAIASPISEDDFSKFGKMEVGDTFKCEIWKERNYLFHRKYFALMNLTLSNLPEDFAVRTTVQKPNGETYEHIEHIDSVNKLRWHVSMQSGQYDTKVTMGGKLIYQVKSISFKSMDDTEFQEIYEAAKNAIWKFFLPMDMQQRIQFENQLLEF